MHRKYGATTDRYWSAFRQQWAFIDRSLIDPEYGGWFSETTRDGKRLGDGAKASPWKANYQTGRAMLRVSRSLAELAPGVKAP